MSRLGATMQRQSQLLQEYQQDLFPMGISMSNFEDASRLTLPPRTASYKAARATKSSD
ncbi:hypothetical protein H6G04_20745 [Calothrix membranacea FACHB-236]|nr:hypothetical protein [Calothrix membranacea FACHB-236]